jgi:hypothetical protein
VPWPSVKKASAMDCDEKSEKFSTVVFADNLNGPFLIVVVDCGVGRKI